MAEDTTPVVIGDEEFIAKLTAQPEAKPNFIDDQGREHLTLTVDDQGNIIGDTSTLPANILEQLQTPEAQAKIRAQYEAYHESGGRIPRNIRYPQEPPLEIRYLNEREDRRVFIDRKPPGMDSQAWRKMCRKGMRNTTKAAKKVLRRMNHERQPN